MPLPRPNTPQTGRFDRGVALFNAGAFFEAHEDWEVLWDLQEEEAERLWLQGMIQLAAAFVHFERGFHARGFTALMADSRKNRGDHAGGDWGLDLGRLEADLRPWRAHADAVSQGADLRADAPPLPHLVYLPGVEPYPLLPDEDEDEDD